MTLSTAPLNLTDDEIHELTGKVRWSAQVKALRSMGLVVKPRPDGKPLVSRDHYQMVMGGKPAQNSELEPDYDALTT